VLYRLREAGFQAYLVGGCVRDLMLGLEPKDFDVATDALPEQVKRLFRNCRLVGRRFRLAHVFFGRDIIEVATFRASGAPLPADEPLPTRDELDEAEGLEAGDAIESGDSDLAEEEAEPPADSREVHDFDESLERVVDQSGRILRDNIYGSIDDDVWRRDFTCNALYYNIADFSVWDYCGGFEDVAARRLRLIGDPETRYREDPVRMLRAVRFAAAIGFEIEAATRAPIRELAPLLSNVPPARLFDEMLKLLLSGGAVACVNRLRDDGLHHGLMPMLDVILEQPMGEKFVMLALANTDARINAGKSVSPAFLFASLLWHEVLAQWKQGTEGGPGGRGKPPMIALAEAMDCVISRQVEQLAIPRRFTAQMREIWFLQPRFDQRFGRRPFRLLEQERFRSGYDFLLLRCESGEVDPEVGEWWTRFQRAGEAEREEMLLPESAAGKPRRRRSRSGRGRTRTEGGGSGEAEGASPAPDGAAPARAGAAGD